MKKNKLMPRMTFMIAVYMLCCTVSSWAVPAYPFKIYVYTANGKSVAISLQGDEYQKYAVSEDGYTLLNDSAGWWYADCDADGNVYKSDYQLSALDDESHDLKAFKANSRKGLMPRRAEAAKLNRAATLNAGQEREPMVGERRALVILMQYTDVKFKKTAEEFQELFNTENYNKDEATGSVRDFYRFASQSQLDYVSDVYGPYTAANTMRYYGRNISSGGSDANPLELCIEAIKCLPKDIDFSLYDNNDDGLVDNVHIIFAGYGEEAGASSDAIWAHEYPHRISLKNEVGYSFAGYSCSPELRNNRGSNITHIGVICHELGHALGAMDYYDTNYTTGGEYDGTGEWDIMASGSWNDNGRTPPNFNPHTRTEVFGWNRQQKLEANQTITIPRREVDNPDESVVYRLETGSSGDYFLLENRQRDLFDAALPGAGLMIYHVHPNIDRYSSTNSINATHPQCFYPVCASYSEPSQKKYGNINSDECPFPGSKHVSSFSSTTSPAAVAWNGSPALTSLSSITMKSSDGSISFMTGKGGGKPEPDEPDEPTEKKLIFYESFESDISGRMDVISNAGKSLWKTYKKGFIVTDASNIPQPTDGNGLVMMSTGKETSWSDSEIISKYIDIEANKNYQLTFDVYTANSSEVSNLSLNVYAEDDKGEYNVFTTKKAEKSWQHVEIPMVFSSDKFRLKIQGIVMYGSLFVDNVRLYCEEEVTRISEPGNSVLNQSTNKVYSLQGVCLGDYTKVKQTLKSGVYIIKYQGKSSLVSVKK